MQNLDLKNKTVFITGVAGFIGSNLAERLLKEIEGIKIVGLDNMNDYYDVRLKEYRLEKLSSSEAFSFVKGNLADKEVVNSIFEKYKPELVVNLGAQAGVRYSITNPDAYLQYAIQPSPDGLAQAFIIGEEFIGDEPVAMVLGDNIFAGHGLKKRLQAAVENFKLENL